ncbi:MAG: hypothetical protein QNJ00_06355 [Woeseiaceae bacterium]|nr:hypothetical protein [Woeseiaceae bacterium]
MARRRLASLTVVAILAACADEPTSGDNITSGAVDTETERVRAWLDETSTAPAAAAAAPAIAADSELPSVDRMIAPLEARLANDPDDLKGWKLLAQSYAYTGRMQDAERALEEAVRLGADPERLRSELVALHTNRRP